MTWGNWHGDMTKDQFIKFGDEISLSAGKRHKMFQGDMIHRDQLQKGTTSTIKIGSNRDILWHNQKDTKNPADKDLKVVVEKFDFEDWTSFRLRDTTSGLLVAVDGDWVRMRKEEDAHPRDTAIMFSKYE